MTIPTSNRHTNRVGGKFARLVDPHALAYGDGGPDVSHDPIYDDLAIPTPPVDWSEFDAMHRYERETWFDWRGTALALLLIAVGGVAFAAALWALASLVFGFPVGEWFA